MKIISHPNLKKIFSISYLNFMNFFFYLLADLVVSNLSTWTKQVVENNLYFWDPHAGFPTNWFWILNKNKKLERWAKLMVRRWGRVFLILSPSLVYSIFKFLFSWVRDDYSISFFFFLIKTIQFLKIR